MRSARAMSPVTPCGSSRASPGARSVEADVDLRAQAMCQGCRARVLKPARRRTDAKVTTASSARTPIPAKSTRKTTFPEPEGVSAAASATSDGPVSVPGDSPVGWADRSARACSCGASRSPVGLTGNASQSVCGVGFGSGEGAAAVGPPRTRARKAIPSGRHRANLQRVHRKAPPPTKVSYRRSTPTPKIERMWEDYAQSAPSSNRRG